MAAVARSVGDLQVAEDAVQEACVAALRQWPVDGVPPSPSAWLVGVARQMLSIFGVQRSGGYIVPSERMDLGEPGKPRCRCRADELEPIRRARG